MTRNNPDKIMRTSIKFKKPKCYGYYFECSNCWNCSLLSMCSDMTQYLERNNLDYGDLK